MRISKLLLGKTPNAVTGVPVVAEVAWPTRPPNPRVDKALTEAPPMAVPTIFPVFGLTPRILAPICRVAVRFSSAIRTLSKTWWTPGMRIRLMIRG